MQHACGDAAQTPVAIVAGILLLLYVVGFPACMVYVMCRHKGRSLSERLAHKDDVVEHESTETVTEQAVPPDYWTSTRPAAEMVWYPLVAHLQVCSRSSEARVSA